MTDSTQCYNRNKYPPRMKPEESLELGLIHTCECGDDFRCHIELSNRIAGEIVGFGGQCLMCMCPKYKFNEVTTK